MSSIADVEPAGGGDPGAELPSDHCPEGPERPEGPVRPAGPEEVRAALIDAASDLLLSHGTQVTVREIARAAHVNHGLVHTYFGSKRALFAAAVDEINARAASEIGGNGYPPPDLAARRSGELGRAIARLTLDEERDLFSSHPVIEAWQSALHRDHPELEPDEISEAVAAGAALALGWAVFGSHLSNALELTDDAVERLDARMSELTAELGRLPARRSPAPDR